MITRTCEITGEDSTGKMYVLRTTEGEELVSPEALFHAESDLNFGNLFLDLVSRVEHLEATLELRDDRDQDEHQDEHQGDKEKASRPATKTAAKKAAPPRQRKASD